MRERVCGDNRKDTIPIPIEQFQRPVLRVDVQLRPETIATVFVAHLKSKMEQIFDKESGVPAACPEIAVEDKDDPIVQALGSARSLILRAAEAAALRSLIIATATGNTKPIIVLGDLNDDLDSVTTRMIAGDDPFFLARPKKEAAFDRLLYSVHDIQERLSHRQFNYSHIYNSRYELLDHIFVSEEFVEQNPKHIAEVRNTRNLQRPPVRLEAHPRSNRRPHVDERSRRPGHRDPVRAEHAALSAARRRSRLQPR